MNLNEIINGCKERDIKSERELFYLYSKKVYSLSRKYTNDHEEAQDLTQECFIKIYSQIHRYFEEKGKFDAWMYRVCVNTILQIFRDNKKSIKIVDIEHEIEIGEEEYDYIEVSGEFIEQAMSELPKGYKEIFSLFVVQNWSHKKIADHLQISEGTSRSQLTKAKKYLRNIINANPTKLYERQEV